MAGEIQFIQCQLRCWGVCNEFCTAKSIKFVDNVSSVLLDTNLESNKCGPIVNMSNNIVNVAYGAHVQLRANIDSSLPIIAVMWYHSDIRIEYSEVTLTGFHFTTENNKDYTILNIRDVTFKDVGNYKVVVENTEGLGSSEANLFVWTMPDPPVQSPQLETSLKDDKLTITLTWEPSIQSFWYEVEQNEKGTFTKVMKVSETKAVFPNVTRGEVRQYRYRAVNPIFVGEPSPVVDVCIEYPATPDKQLNMTLQDLEKYNSNFTPQNLLGTGSFGKVVLVTENATRKQYAAKIMKTKISKKRVAALREFEILKTLCHDKIIQIYACYFEKYKVVIVTEYLSGGELFERVIQEDSLTEADCIMYIRQVCVGVAYLHSKSIAHLDLKAENIMCVSKNSKQVKIIDLGLAHYIRDDSPEIRAMYGTRDYVAPEIIKYDPITLKTDMWCIGIITYVLISGLLPFSGDSWLERSTNIQRVNYNYDDDVFDYVSPEAKQFIDGLLIMPPENRLSPTECLDHPWLLKKRESRVVYTLERTKRNLKTFLETYRSKWHPPKPAQEWKGIKNATEPSPPCVQRNPYTREKDISGQEDCLYLNVYTPQTEFASVTDKNQNLLPVMFFVHGGGWMCGHSSTYMYGPEHLLDRDVLLVATNYRLGPLGFLSTQDAHCPGNNGLKDQQAALRWVKQNIQKFGGDPNSVTIFGESAGGASVHYHMISPTSAGLFHKAISESGTALVPWAEASPGESLRNAFRLAKFLNCPQAPSEKMLACLRTKDAYDIIGTEFKFYAWDYEPMTPFKAVVEPDLPDAFLTKSPRKIPDVPAVPWMTGLNKDEGCLKSVWITANNTRLEEFLTGFDAIAPITFYYENSPQIDEITRVLRQFYLDSDDNEVKKQNILKMYSDSYFDFPAVDAVDLTLQYTKNPIYLYELAYRGTNSFSQIFGDSVGDYGVCHADELQYLFPIHFFEKPMSAGDIEMSKLIVTLWTNFASTGNPNAPNKVPLKWHPVTDVDSMEYLEINKVPKMNKGLAERSKLWGALPLWFNKNKRSFYDEL